MFCLKIYVKAKLSGFILLVKKGRANFWTSYDCIPRKDCPHIFFPTAQVEGKYASMPPSWKRSQQQNENAFQSSIFQKKTQTKPKFASLAEMII